MNGGNDSGNPQASRKAIDSLIRLIEEAFKGDDHSVLGNLRHLRDEDWTGASRLPAVRAMPMLGARCKAIFLIWR